jgi:hypothetical protein
VPEFSTNKLRVTRRRTLAEIRVRVTLLRHFVCPYIEHPACQKGLRETKALSRVEGRRTL